MPKHAYLGTSHNIICERFFYTLPSGTVSLDILGPGHPKTLLLVIKHFFIDFGPWGYPGFRARGDLKTAGEGGQGGHVGEGED